MTKAPLTGLVRGAAIDLAPRTITVNNIQPGPTATDMSAPPQRRFPMPESPPEGAWDLCVCWVPQGQISSSMTKRTSYLTRRHKRCIYIYYEHTNFWRATWECTFSVAVHVSEPSPPQPDRNADLRRGIATGRS